MTAEVLPDLAKPLLDVTIGDRLRERAAALPDRPALQWATPDGEVVSTLTYRELLATAEDLAVEILENAAPGDRVAVWAANSPEWVLVECACALAGTVLTGFNTAWTDDEVRHALALTSPRILFAGPDNRGVDLRPRAFQLAGTDGTCRVVDVEAVGTDPAEATRRLTTPPTIDPEDPFLIQFTSGTTGRAKGATLSHRAALNAGWIRALTFDAAEDDVWVNPVPLHHIGGSCIILLAALSSGGAYVVQERFDPASMVRLMAVTGATRTGGVPTMLYALLEVPGAHDAIGSVRSVGLGGTSVPPSLVERIQQDYGATVSVAYAQSECPMITSTLPDAAPVDVATTVGVAAPHTGIRIIRPDGALAERGEVGEVIVRSPLTMTGYWDMPEATAEVLDDEGFLHTGDLGSIDGDGVVRIHGRAREVIIRGGENVYPIEVEDALLRHPAVDSAAVLATPSARWGEEVAAVVRLADGQVADAADLEAYAGETLSHFKVPRHWQFVDQMPLTASGKIRKVDLADLFAAEGDG